MAGESIFLRVVDAVIAGIRRRAFVAADEYSQEILADRNIKVGDTLTADLRQNRDHTQFRRAHALGKLLATNLHDFDGLTAHDTLKRLQAKAGVECVEYTLEGIDVPCPDCGVIFPIPAMVSRTPRSLAFGSMPQSRYNEFERQIKAYIIRNYWQACTESELDDMVSKLLRGASGA